MKPDKIKNNTEEISKSASQNNTEIDKAKAELRKIEKALIKTVAMTLISGIILIFATFSWFTYNKSISFDGMNNKAADKPFSIITVENEGIYSEQYKSYKGDNADAEIWLVNSDHNFDNDSTATSENLGIEPGDRGVLQFRIEPTNDTITVDLEFELTAIKQDDENENSFSTIEDSSLIKYLNAHIMLFESYDQETKKYSDLIDSDAELKRVLSSKIYNKSDTAYTEIYWVWPEYLNNLVIDDQLIYNSGEKTKIIQYIVKNKTGFFKNINVEDDVLLSNLTSGTNYSTYSIMYDSADLEIGNKIDYVILAMTANESTQQ